MGYITIGLFGETYTSHYNGKDITFEPDKKHGWVSLVDKIPIDDFINEEREKIKRKRLKERLKMDYGIVFTEETLWNIVVNMKNTLIFYLDGEPGTETKKLAGKRLSAAKEILSECRKIKYNDIEVNYLEKIINQFDGK